MEHEDRALLERQASERAVELVTVMDRQDAVLGDRLLGWQEANVGRPAAATACLRVALVRQDPVQPRLEAVGVAKGWKIAPRTHERGLHRVLGQVGVAEDPRCDRHAAVAHLPREGVERFLVTTLRQVHELSPQRMPHFPIAMTGQQNDARGGVKGSISATRRPRTDPPYGVGYEGKTERLLRIRNDDPETSDDVIGGAFR